MKKIIIIVLTSIISLSFYYSVITTQALETLTRQKLPYEIKSIQLKNDHLIITGWAFLNGMQHFESEATHSYQIEAKSTQETKTYLGEIRAVSQTETMKYNGAKKCAKTNYYQDAANCYYNYENVGFYFNIPLSQFQRDEIYYFDLIVTGKDIDKSFSIPFYYPMLEDIVLKRNHLEYRIISRLKDSELIITHNMIIARNTPSKTGRQYQGSTSCSTSYGKYLYFKDGAIFKNISDKVLVGENTYYQVSGKEEGCFNGVSQLIEGNKFFPVWIVSNFVDYGGEPLKLTVNPINDDYTFRFIDKAVIENDPDLPVNWTKKELLELYNDESILIKEILK